MDAFANIKRIKHMLHNFMYNKANWRFESMLWGKQLRKATDLQFVPHVTGTQERDFSAQPVCLAANGGAYKLAWRTLSHIVQVVTLHEAENEESGCSVYGCLAVYQHGSG